MNKIVMRAKITIPIIALMSFLVGTFVERCITEHSSPVRETQQGCVTDTVTYIDTILYVEPAPKTSTMVGYTEVKVSRGNVKFETDTLPRVRADTMKRVDCPDDVIIIDSKSTDDADSMTITLPVVQNIYEAAEYRAYVSGVSPKLDSIYIYPRHEVITIRPRTKHWHIGVTGGYGCTPRGFEPFIGIGVTYSVFSF